MSVTELHLLPDDLRSRADALEVRPLGVGPLEADLMVDLVVDTLVVDLLVVEPLERGQPEHRQAPSIAVLILDHAPDPTEVSHLYEDFEVVLIAHDAASAVRMLEGMVSAATSTAVVSAPVAVVSAPVPPAPVVLDPVPPAPVVLLSVPPVSPVFDAYAVARGPAEVEVELGLTLDEVHHLASWQGRPLPLTSRERAILGCLLGDPGRVWSYRELFEHAWGGYYLGDPALVHSALKRVRRKIRDADVALTIDAVRGVGFRAQPDS